MAYGYPMPSVRWMKAGMDLDDLDNLPLGRNVLKLGDIYESANYTCVATSLLGTIDTSARVTVRIVCPVVTVTAPDDLEQKICDSDNIFIVKVRPDGRAKILNDLTNSINLYADDRPIVGFIRNDVCNVELTEERYMLFMAGEAVNVPGKKFTLDHTVLAMPMTGDLKVKVKEIRPLCPVA
ncbi:receptor-type tyrosine-protein phosphatase S-like [Strongylocentrotus purpuratus]|uniref:protein-tyrosine-phosphatase n=1 Tax=Strongylocentrotus purpuratus TaxID=7668 RepID=A0A7M7PKV0_STRPU|nr:receptor-type tyrosine-protein phosphatase S-like [Strongylocentrotus purpuratus]